MRTRRNVRTPTLLQLDAAECGAACLGIVLAHYGRHVPLAELRRDCGVSRDGSRASNVVRAARLHGLDARGMKRDVDELRGVHKPLIAHWQFNHFVVVESIGGRHVRLNDPRFGHVRVSRDEFDRSFTGVALEFAPNAAFERRGKPVRLLRSLAPRIWTHRRSLAFGTLAGWLLVIPSLVLSGCAGAFIDGVLIEGQRSWMRPLVWILLAAAAVQWVVLGLQRRGLRLAYRSAIRTETAELVDRLLRLPLAFFTQRQSGEIANRIQYAEHVGELLTHRVADSGIEFGSMVAYFAAMSWIAPPLAAATGVLAAFNALALLVAFRKRTEVSQRIARAEGRWVGASLIGVQMIEPMKAGGMESGYVAKWSGYQRESAGARQELERSVIGLETLPGLTERLALTTLLCLGGYFVMRGSMTVGSLVAFQILLARFSAPLQSLVALAAEWQTAHADFLRLDDVRNSATDPLSEDDRRESRSDAAASTAASADSFGSPGHAVALSDVTFGYGPLDPPLLDGIQLALRPGECLAVVGGSGSGKSTLARLVCGLHAPWKGKILHDGRALSDMARSERVRRIAYVDQDVMLFAGSIRDNLSLWNGGFSDEALWEACDDACIGDVVRGVPGQLDAPLRENGANLSGGERQRIELARAFACRPSLLVLDEAMSALDGPTEARVIESIRRRGCTTILITHRIEAAQTCDAILVLEQGRIRGLGTHDRLRAACAEYGRLLGTASPSPRTD
ncbi:MAG: ATP-binding cassette domain-containing protein [Planctomycetes bacterium]|nr:ATP-binding cassette domain-containing protein [Planctomycetota bacterium]